nr:Uma2 family endonuclease [Anaerolineae bacterium]
MMQPPTAIRTGMALAEFIREHEAAPFELIGTERIPRMPTTSGHNDLMDRLYTLLKEHVQQAGTVRMEATFVLPEAYDAAWVTGARTPDVLYYAAERLNAYKAAHPDWPRTPY